MAREYDNIADAISAVNGEVGEQSTKIADILEALEGKAGGGISDVEEVTITSAIINSTNLQKFLRGLIPNGKTRVIAMLKGKALSDFNDSQFIYATFVVSEGDQSWTRYNTAAGTLTSSNAIGGNAVKLDVGDKIVVTFL